LRFDSVFAGVFDSRGGADAFANTSRLLIDRHLKCGDRQIEISDEGLRHSVGDECLLMFNCITGKGARRVEQQLVVVSPWHPKFFFETGSVDSQPARGARDCFDLVA